MLTRSTQPSERGSVALAVTVIVILAGLTAVMLTRDTSELRQSRTSQDRAAVLGALDDAVAAGSARAARETAGFTMSGTAGSTAWELRASVVDADTWELTADAGKDPLRRGVSARLVRVGGSDWRVTDWRESHT